MHFLQRCKEAEHHSCPPLMAFSGWISKQRRHTASLFPQPDPDHEGNPPGNPTQGDMGCTKHLRTFTPTLSYSPAWGCLSTLLPPGNFAASLPPSPLKQPFGVVLLLPRCSSSPVSTQQLRREVWHPAWLLQRAGSHPLSPPSGSPLPHV